MPLQTIHMEITPYIDHPQPNPAQLHTVIAPQNETEQVTLNQTLPDFANDQIVLEPHPVSYSEPCDHHKSPSREEYIVLETNTVHLLSPFTPHLSINLNLNLSSHRNY